MQTLLLSLAVLVLPVAADDVGSGVRDAKLFQGTWIMVSAEEDGAKKDEDYVKKSKLVVKDDHHTVTLGDKTMKASQKLDPSKTPKTIDITVDDGMVLHGIYELNDSEFKICVSTPGKPAPQGVFRQEGFRPDAPRLEAREEVSSLARRIRWPDALAEEDWFPRLHSRANVFALRNNEITEPGGDI